MPLSGIQSGINFYNYRNANMTPKKERCAGYESRKGAGTVDISLDQKQTKRSEQNAIASMGLSDGSGMSVYYSEKSTDEVPILKVKSWDTLGNEDSKEIEVNKINPKNCSYQELMAFTAYMNEQGEINSSGVPMVLPGGSANTVPRYQDFFRKIDYLAEMQNGMGMQFKAGNIQGYHSYKMEYDMLSEVVQNQEKIALGEQLAASHALGAKRAPYSYMANEHGEIEYNGVVFGCNNDREQLTLGDVSNRDNILNIPMAGGGCLLVNRDNLGQLAQAIGMFSAEDVGNIMEAIAQDAKIQQLEKEIEDAVNSIGEESKVNDASDD